MKVVKKNSKDKKAVTLFGVDISGFNEKQQAYLINARYSKTPTECAKATGVSRQAVTIWRKQPEFKRALLQIKHRAIQVDVQAAENPHIVQARKAVQDIVADVAPTAAKELAILVQKDWDACTDRGKSTKLKGIEDAFKVIGVESKPKQQSGKIDFVELIMEIVKEREDAVNSKGT